MNVDEALEEAADCECQDCMRGVSSVHSVLNDEVRRLRAEQKLDGAEIERLQKVVADQALTIGTLKDELGQLRGLLCQHGDGTQPASDEQDISNLRRWKSRVEQLETALSDERSLTAAAAEHTAQLERKLECKRVLIDAMRENGAAELARETDSKNRAYKERNALVAALSRIFESHLCKHDENDTTWERDWMNIVCIHAPVVGQLTWHLHDSDLPLFKHLQEGPNHWDGHTTEEKYLRLASLPFFEVLPGSYRSFEITGLDNPKP